MKARTYEGHGLLYEEGEGGGERLGTDNRISVWWNSICCGGELSPHPARTKLIVVIRNGEMMRDDVLGRVFADYFTKHFLGVVFAFWVILGESAANRSAEMRCS